MSFGRRWGHLNPYDLHKTLINEYFLTTKNRTSLLKRDTSKDKTDIDVIRENHQFLWEDEEESSSQSWEKRLAKKYYDKLYKEYCIADLSRYKENKFGMRWRTEQELIDGRGQFSCGNKKCSSKEDLRTWEVNFGYIEHGIKKNALVKLRLCPDCSHKLNYHHKKKEVKRLKTRHKAVHESCGVKHKEQIKDKSDESDKSESKEEETDNKSSTESSKDECDEDVWRKQDIPEEEGKSREEEFDEYLDQLFL